MKTAKNLVILGAVGALVACSGIKWVKSDFESAKNNANNVGDHVAEVINFDNLKLSASTYSKTEETAAKGHISRNEINDYKIDIDVTNMKIHVKEYEKDFADGTKVSDKSDDESTTELWYSYNSKNGIILQINEDGEKTYIVIADPDAIKQSAESAELTVKETVQKFFGSLASSMITPSLVFAPVLTLLSYSEPFGYEYSGYENFKIDCAFYEAGDGYIKGDTKATFSYDDKEVGGYDVNGSCTAKLLITNWLGEFSSVYNEKGKYYVTAEEKVDYTYKSEQKVKVTDKASISVPSLSGYKLIETVE